MSNMRRQIEIDGHDCEISHSCPNCKHEIYRAINRGCFYCGFALSKDNVKIKIWIPVFEDFIVRDALRQKANSFLKGMEKLR